MEHDPEQQDEQPKPVNWIGVIVKIIVGIVVLFIAAFALVFGACLLG